MDHGKPGLEHRHATRSHDGTDPCGEKWCGVHVSRIAPPALKPGVPEYLGYAPRKTFGACRYAAVSAMIVPWRVAEFGLAAHIQKVLIAAQQ
jgi:hypothetical protein